MKPLRCHCARGAQPTVRRRGGESGGRTRSCGFSDRCAADQHLHPEGAREGVVLPAGFEPARRMRHRFLRPARLPRFRHGSAILTGLEPATFRLTSGCATTALQDQCVSGVPAARGSPTSAGSAEFPLDEAWQASPKGTLGTVATRGRYVERTGLEPADRLLAKQVHYQLCYLPWAGTAGRPVQCWAAVSASAALPVRAVFTAG